MGWWSLLLSTTSAILRIPLVDASCGPTQFPDVMKGQSIEEETLLFLLELY